jgi:3-oxoacyl-[acyl-carrier protein] reductase
MSQGVRVAAQHKTQPPPEGALPVRADLGTEAGCVEAVRGLGEVQLLVHSAGIYNTAPIGSITAQQLEEMFRVNVFSAFYLVRELLLHGLRNVVLIGSTAGQRGEPRHAHYAASKGALQSMMMSIAVELAPKVRVNLVSPGSASGRR